MMASNHTRGHQLSWGIQSARWEWRRDRGPWCPPSENRGR